MKRTIVLAAVLAAACAHAPSRGPALTRVDAEGWAPLTAAGALDARRRALVEAQRAAVEKAVGVTLTARTRVAGAVAVDARVETRAAGTVRDFSILSEKDEEGFHKVRLRALVEIGAPPPSGERPAPPPGDPKVSVHLIGPRAEDAAAGVRRGLLARCYTVVDGPKADLIVDGSVAVRELGGIGPFSSWRARVSLALRRPATGEVLAQESREASAADPMPTAAGDRAAETAGELSAASLALSATPRLAD
jgi:hypothetical protein